MTVKPTPKPLAETVWVMNSTPQSITDHKMDENFFPRLMAGEITGDALVTFYYMDGDFPHWEMHPNGDELFILTDGEIEVHLDDDGNTSSLRLKGGETCLIPKGVWHMAKTVAPGQLIIITYGDGTQHRPI